MEKSTEVRLAQLQTAVSYLADLLEEGSLVERYDAETRREMAVALRLLLQKSADLPAAVPQRLVQATAVRAIIGAATLDPATAETREAQRAQHMRESATAAGLGGHDLGPWRPVSAADPADMEMMATCQNCDGVVYVNHASSYRLLADECPGLASAGQGQ